MKLTLAQIGESLFSTLLLRHPELLENLLREADLPEFLEQRLEVGFNLPLLCVGGRSFDGVHRIDVGIFNSEERVCLPVVLKTGNTWFEKELFEKQFLQECNFTGNNRRISGDMLAILERKFPLDDDIMIQFNDIAYAISREWLLICRRETIQYWWHHGFPELSRSCRSFSLEGLIEQYVPADIFNPAVRSLVEFDYFKEWILE